jgi:hypothetical protein
MDLANMRQNGVRRLAFSCQGRDCWHSAVLDVSAYPGDFLVQSFRLRARRLPLPDIDVPLDWAENPLRRPL